MSSRVSFFSVTLPSGVSMTFTFRRLASRSRLPTRQTFSSHHRQSPATVCFSASAVRRAPEDALLSKSQARASAFAFVCVFGHAFLRHPDSAVGSLY